MRIAIYTLPRAKGALGGEDQVGFYLSEALTSMGHEATIFYPHESSLLCSKKNYFDCLISNGVDAISPIQPSCYWHFNESTSFDGGMSLRQMGYTHFATAAETRKLSEKMLSDIGIEPFHLPLAAHAPSCKNPIERPDEDDRVVYIGNLNEYKRSAIERWLNPIADAFGDRFQIFGGTAWRGHQRFSAHYRGVFPRDHWTVAATHGSTWINFRSDAQRDMGMMNDRVFWLLGIGVQRLLSDNPPCSMIEEFVHWCETPDDMVRAVGLGHTRCAVSEIMETHTYELRLRKMLGEMGLEA